MVPPTPHIPSVGPVWAPGEQAWATFALGGIKAHVSITDPGTG